jgi:hypothetical protein
MAHLMAANKAIHRAFSRFGRRPVDSDRSIDSTGAMTSGRND